MPSIVVYCAKTRPPDHITPHHITPHRIASHITSRQRLSPQTVPKHRIGHAHLWSECRPRTPSARMPAAHTFGQNRPRTPSVRMPAAHTFGQNDRKLPEGVRRWAFSGVSKTSPQTTPKTTHLPDPSQTPGNRLSSPVRSDRRTKTLQRPPDLSSELRFRGVNWRLLGASLRRHLRAPSDPLPHAPLPRQHAGLCTCTHRQRCNFPYDGRARAIPSKHCD